MSLIHLGMSAIMFGDIDGCGACAMQDKLLKEKFKNGHYLYINVNKNKYASALLKNRGIPTWYTPKTSDGYGILRSGVIKNVTEKLLENGHVEKKWVIKPRLNKKKIIKQKFQFGNTIPEIGTLAKYGRNFPDKKEFQIPDSWTNEITNKWGNPLNSGTLGREFGPGGTDKIYSNNYYNDIRMAYPGGDLDTTLNLNRTCNQYDPVHTQGTPVGAIDYPVLNTAGMIYNSPNPQITSFGKRRRPRFGDLYSQMGPVPASNYLLNNNTFNNMYAGGGQGGPPRPYKGDNQKLYINSSPVYYPVKSITNFGAKISKIIKKKIKLVKKVKPVKNLTNIKKDKKDKKVKKNKKPGEGSTLTIRKGKVVVTH